VRVVVVAFALLAACNSEHKSDSSFTAKVEQALNLELAGTSGFWCVTRPLKMCAMHMYVAGTDADSINFTVMNSGRPQVGTYDVTTEVDPTGRAMRVNYLSGGKGDHESYVAKTGKITIDSSQPTHVTGSFELDAQGTEPKGETFPTVKITGRFNAECQLELRSAYTCE
jgi:hypothetical protein